MKDLRLINKQNRTLPHPVTLRDQGEVVALRAKFGPAGYAVYCWLLEDILANGGCIPIDWRDIQEMSADYRVDPEMLGEFINYAVKMGLFLVSQNPNGEDTVAPQQLLSSTYLDEYCGVRENTADSKRKAGRSGARRRWKKANGVEDVVLAEEETYVDTTPFPAPEPEDAVVEEPHLEDTPEPEEVTALPTEVLYPRHAQFVDALKDYYNALVERNGSQMPKCGELSAELKDRAETLLVTLGKDFLKGAIERATQDSSCDRDFKWVMGDEFLLFCYQN